MHRKSREYDCNDALQFVSSYRAYKLKSNLSVTTCFPSFTRREQGHLVNVCNVFLNPLFLGLTVERFLRIPNLEVALSVEYV
jgi:hypothetical protein